MLSSGIKFLNCSNIYEDHENKHLVMQLQIPEYGFYYFFPVKLCKKAGSLFFCYMAACITPDNFLKNTI
jgi:hypothetical protein